MSLSDPIGDMLARIRNAGKSGKPDVVMPYSKEKAAIAELLKENGYIFEYSASGEVKKELRLGLKYKSNQPVIEGMKRVSKPSRRVYTGSQDIPRVMGGFGIAVMSTSRGFMTGRTAKKENIGGEVICYVW